MNILFVCTGNTCRSPLAEAYLRWKRPDWAVDSAGVAVEVGSPATESAQKVAAEAGLSLSDHRARSVHRLALEQYDRIFTMSLSHLQRLPEGAGAAVLSSVDGREVSVKDPFGGALDEYRRAFEEIKHYLDVFLNGLEQSEK